MSDVILEYNLSERVCDGPLGMVWSAHSSGSDPEPVFVMFLDDEDTRAEREDALEARLAAADGLRHPFITRLLGVQAVEGRTAAVFEHVDGCTLERLMEHGPVPVEVTIEIVRKIVRALHAAWDRVPTGGDAAFGLVHGELSPRYIWVGRGGQVRVAGFGVPPSGPRGSAVPSGTMSEAGAWASPESFDGEVTHASDMYAAGALFAQLLSGAPPPPALASAESHGRAIRSLGERLERAGVASNLTAMALSCMCFDPDERPSASDFERSLNAIRRDLVGVQLPVWCGQRVPASMSTQAATTDGSSGGPLPQPESGDRAEIRSLSPRSTATSASDPEADSRWTEGLDAPSPGALRTLPVGDGAGSQVPVEAATEQVSIEPLPPARSAETGYAIRDDIASRHVLSGGRGDVEVVSGVSGTDEASDWLDELARKAALAKRSEQAAATAAVPSAETVAWDSTEAATQQIDVPVDTTERTERPVEDTILPGVKSPEADTGFLEVTAEPPAPVPIQVQTPEPFRRPSAEDGRSFSSAGIAVMVAALAMIAVSLFAIIGPGDQGVSPATPSVEPSPEAPSAPDRAVQLVPPVAPDVVAEPAPVDGEAAPSAPPEAAGAADEGVADVPPVSADVQDEVKPARAEEPVPAARPSPPSVPARPVSGSSSPAPAAQPASATPVPEPAVTPAGGPALPTSRQNFWDKTPEQQGPPASASSNVVEEAGARVSVTGDVSRVELIGDNGRFGPGVVPAGAYRVVATFSAAGFPLPQGSITVSEGQQLEIRCDGTFMRCEVQ